MSVQWEFLGDAHVFSINIREIAMGYMVSIRLGSKRKKEDTPQKDKKTKATIQDNLLLNIKETFKPKSVSLSISESTNPTDWDKNYQDHHPDFEAQPQISAARDITWLDLFLK